MVDLTIAMPEKTPTSRRARLGLNGMRLTIWDILVSVAQPVSAYWLIDELRTTGKSVAPPTVYRALSFLQSAGMVHRVESLNAFVACKCTDHAHQGQFLICSECGRTEEISDHVVSEMVHASASAHGFTPTQQVIELNGVCRNCSLEAETARRATVIEPEVGSA